MTDMATLRARPMSSRADSHVQQAVIRLLLTGSVIAALLLHLGLPLSRAVEACRCLPLLLSYVPAGLLLLGWSMALKRGCERTPSLHLRLSVALLTDLFVTAAFTAFGGHYAPLSLPVFLAIIVGYGWRFGARYAIAASALGLAAFSGAQALNPLFQMSPGAALGYYVCFVAVPMYLLQAWQQPVLAPAALAHAVASPVGVDDDDRHSGDDEHALLDFSLVDELRATCVDALMWQLLIGQFEQEAEQLYSHIAQALAAEDGQACRTAVHQLRGTAASMGARRLDARLTGLEHDDAWSAETLAECRQLTAGTVRHLQAAP